MAQFFKLGPAFQDGDDNEQLKYGHAVEGVIKELLQRCLADRPFLIKVYTQNSQHSTSFLSTFPYLTLLTSLLFFTTPHRVIHRRLGFF
jgi:hypothetical protein